MTQTSKEYAEALFTLAQEEGKLESISASLDIVLDVIKANPEYMDFLSSPNIKKEERIGAIEAAFDGKVEEYVVSFLSLLCENGRILSLVECIEAFKEFCDIANRISVAQVVSAVELTETEKSALKAKLEKICKNAVTLVCSVDKELMGGMIVTVDGKVIDGSVRHKLHELKGVMYG